jgi:secondary thiamine-phosphate synthase enzyme
VIQQYTISLPVFKRGFHLITNHVLEAGGKLPDMGLMHVFIQHTSAGICINENADSTVLDDFETVFNKLVKENEPYYTHDMEGPDDMPAHIKAAMIGSSVTLPITNGKLNLGVWQGIYLGEFRNRGGNRKLVITIYS